MRMAAGFFIACRMSPASAFCYHRYMSEEMIEVVDSEGNVISIARRSEVHGNPALMHRVVHVLVFGSDGRLYLQKRSMNKDVAPGLWDTSVGGHVDPGEALPVAAMREMKEELGVECEPEYLYTYVHSNDYETEQVHTFRCTHDGPFSFNVEEIDELRAWSLSEIEAQVQSGTLSHNFIHEINTYVSRYGRQP